MDSKDKPIIQLEDGWREIKQIALDPLEVSEFGDMYYTLNLLIILNRRCSMKD